MKHNERCSNCAHFRKIEAHNFLNNGGSGVEHITLPGYACVSYDNIVIYALGLDPSVEMCELWSEIKDGEKNECEL